MTKRDKEVEENPNPSPVPLGDVPIYDPSKETTKDEDKNG